MERVFRQNTFTQVKEIKKHKERGNYYILSVDGLGFCCGTSFVYVKSEKTNKKKKSILTNLSKSIVMKSVILKIIYPIKLTNNKVTLLFVL